MEIFILFASILLVPLLLGVGIGSLVIKAMSRKAEKKGLELLHYLRCNPYDVRNILGEMRFIAEESFDLYDEWNINKAKASKDLKYGLTNSKRQNKLALAMNHNVKAEWIPRFKFLNEIQNSFYKDSDLHNAFKACRDINKGIRKLSLWNINLSTLYESYRENAKFALKATAIGTVASIAVAGGMLSMVKKQDVIC